MKVLYVSHRAELGGAERSLLELMVAMRELAGSNVEPALACPEGELAHRSQAVGIDWYQVPMHTIRWRPRSVAAIPGMVAATQDLGRLMARHDLVHTNSTQAQLWSAWAIDRSNTPWVWHWRDFYHRPWLARILGRGSGFSVPISSAVFEFARKQLGSAQRLRLVNNGIAPLHAPSRSRLEAARARWNVQPDEFVVAAAGQALPRKGFSTLIAAVHELAGAGLRPHLLLALNTFDVTATSHQRELIDLAARWGRARVDLVPPQDDVAELFSVAHVVAVPSLEEPFGRVAVEAMALARPVVASATGGLAEIVVPGVTGLLVPAGRPDLWARGMAQLAEQPQWARDLGLAGRERVEVAYLIPRVAGEILSVYRELTSL